MAEGRAATHRGPGRAEDAGAVEPGGAFHVLVVAGSPAPSSPSLVARLAGEADYVVAADAGAAPCRAAGVAPDAFVGDADSAAPDVAAWARAVAATSEAHPSRKDDTDLELAIALARRGAARRGAPLALTLTCAAGGRPDHALAVLGRLAAHADLAPREVEDAFECRVLSPRGAAAWRVGEVAAPGATFSVIALVPGTVASERGMRWELDREPLEPLGDRGVSNVVESDAALVTCHEGILACYLLRHPE